MVALTHSQEGNAPLLIPGSTCWRKVISGRLSLIPDAGPTFAAIAAAMEAARRTIFILGWDLDSRTVLRPGATDPERRTLMPLLCRCLEAQPTLEIFVLVWDFSFIYSFEREPRPRAQFGRAHPRLHFSMDADHGTGGSHHQKIVVVDDAVAFLGGVDLTLHRWDIPAHHPIDSRRVDASGQAYDPFHDVHAAVSGPAAAALGELARVRWQTRRRRPTPPLPPSPTDGARQSTGTAWPAELPVDATDMEVALARTLVSSGQPTIREIAALTEAAIAAAERWIYAENQYLTSGVVVRALGERLAEPHGPEIVLVLPAGESGWKEQSSMGILRAEALAYLQHKDLHGRLRLLSPVVTRDGQSRRVAVHAKVLVVDDRLAKVGSANFSNRSMGLDSECDLAVEARDQASATFVASVRNRLLGEHLGLAPDEVARRLAAHGSLLRLVNEQPTSPERSLLPTPVEREAPFDFTVLDGAMVDPPEPWNATLLLERAVPVPFRRRLARRWLRPLALVAAVILVWAILRRWGPEGDSVYAALKGTAEALARRPAGAFIAVAAYALAGALFIPVTLLATTALTVFGTWPGVAVAWVGGLLAATLSHELGSRLGPRAISWLPDRAGATLRRLLTRRAFWSVVFIRLLPVGNFGALNVVAGAVKVPRRSFLFGNMVGLLPGLLGLGVLVNRVLAALREPSWFNVSVTVATLGFITGIAILVKRRFMPKRIDS